jgi:hypothetical protein
MRLRRREVGEEGGSCHTTLRAGKYAIGCPRLVSAVAVVRAPEKVEVKNIYIPYIRAPKFKSINGQP